MKTAKKLGFNDLLEMGKMVLYLPEEIALFLMQKMTEDFDEVYYEGNMGRDEIREAVRWIRSLKHAGKVFAIDRNDIVSAMEKFDGDERVAIGEWLLLSTRI